MSKQQLYFLTIEPDDFSEITSKSGGRRSMGSRGCSQLGSVASIEEVNEEETPSRRSSERSEARQSQAAASNKPFQFSDFASQPVGRSESPNVSEDSEIRAASETGAVDDEDDDDAFRSGNGGDEEVFRVTTQAEMNSMMSEYRFRKRKRTLPSTASSKDSPGVSAATSGRKNPFLAKPPVSATNSSSAAAAAAGTETLADRHNFEKSRWMTTYYVHTSAKIALTEQRTFFCGKHNTKAIFVFQPGTNTM